MYKKKRFKMEGRCIWEISLDGFDSHSSSTYPLLFTSAYHRSDNLPLRSSVPWQNPQQELVKKDKGPWMALVGMPVPGDAP